MVERVTMKADSRPSAENEALQWAVDHFRKQRDQLTPDGSRRGLAELFDGFALYTHDRFCDDPELLDTLHDMYARYVEAAHDGHREIGRLLRMLAATLIDRGDQLPKPIRSFIAEFLRNPNKRIKRLRPKPIWFDLRLRDSVIVDSIEHIVETWKFSATRNEATERASAASIVREAIEKGGGIPLTEKAVNKIWNVAVAETRNRH